MAYNKTGSDTNYEQEEKITIQDCHECRYQSIKNLEVKLTSHKKVVEILKGGYEYIMFRLSTEPMSNTALKNHIESTALKVKALRKIAEAEGE